MTTLLVAKQYMKLFYSKYEIYITPFLKFLLAFTALRLINSRLGYMAAVNCFDRSPDVLFYADEFYCDHGGAVYITASVCIQSGMYDRDRGGFFADVSSVFQIFAQGYGGRCTDAGLFCSENTVCDPDLHGTDRYTDIGSIRSMRHNCILYDPLCECKRFFIKRNDRRRDGGEIQDCHRRHFE